MCFNMFLLIINIYLFFILFSLRVPCEQTPFIVFVIDDKLFTLSEFCLPIAIMYVTGELPGRRWCSGWELEW